RTVLCSYARTDCSPGASLAEHPALAIQPLVDDPRGVPPENVGRAIAVEVPHAHNLPVGADGAADDARADHTGPVQQPLVDDPRGVPQDTLVHATPGAVPHALNLPLATNG